MTEKKLKEKSTRVKRSRLQKKGPMYINEKYLEEGFHYRIVNDKDGNVQSRIDQGYQVVQNTDATIGEGLNTGSKLGSTVTKHVGGSINGILMRIPLDEHQEILDELEELNSDVDATILNRSGINAKEVYGSVTRKDTNK